MPGAGKGRARHSLQARGGRARTGLFRKWSNWRIWGRLRTGRFQFPARWNRTFMSVVHAVVSGPEPPFIRSRMNVHFSFHPEP